MNSIVSKEADNSVRHFKFLLTFYEDREFDLTLSQLDPIKTQQFSYTDFNITNTNTSTSSFLGHFLR